MICKLAKGNGFNGRLKYASKGLLISTNLTSDPADIKSMAREMRAVSNQNKRISEPVKAIILSWDSKKETISHEKQRQIIHRALELSGYGNSPFVGYLHTDASRDHLDITTSRVDYEGKTVKDKHERLEWQKICRKIEQEFGLRTLELTGQEKIAPTTAEKAMIKKGQLDSGLFPFAGIAKLPVLTTVRLNNQAQPAAVRKNSGFIGLSISALSLNMHQAMVYAFVLIMPLILLSGLVTPVGNMPSRPLDASGYRLDSFPRH